MSIWVEICEEIGVRDLSLGPGSQVTRGRFWIAAGAYTVPFWLTHAGPSHLYWYGPFGGFHGPPARGLAGAGGVDAELGAEGSPIRRLTTAAAIVILRMDSTMAGVVLEVEDRMARDLTRTD
ncbi:hypothetical protein Back2_19290 [Nocardioides baekrokdamisoli]|uniref:Uncharacterized protein n=1 Tax=Nocardioides baekrokdamisoli TaxID=1804624 RepID=A0A3G9IHG4_9ACTN|nr:hypothetical protein Back2_19290 [Nocardioides baekrokdamisoli]